jgi:RNA polymerase sigma-70 factor (ECF subfamily)
MRILRRLSGCEASVVDLRAGLAARIVWAARLQGGTRQLTSGEEAEFTAMVLRQSRFVFRVAYAVLVNAHDAEDAVQETFLKLYRHGGWQHAKNERAYLARVAWRAAIDRRRANAAPAANGTFSATEGEAGVDLPSPRPDPEQVVAAANEQALIHAMIDGLPEDLRVPLVLSAFEELNSREIGRILGVPEGTVRTRLQRAREVLRRKLTVLRQTHTAEAGHA